MRVIIVALLAALAGACGSVKAPEVRLDDVRLGGLGVRGGTLHAEFVVYNPNGFALEAESLTYDLRVGEPGADEDTFTQLAEGTYEERVRVEGRDSVRIEIPVDFRYAGMGGAIRSLLERGVFEYRVTGEVDVREPSRRRVPYRETGRYTMGE